MIGSSFLLEKKEDLHDGELGTSGKDLRYIHISMKGSFMNGGLFVG